jgi:glutamate-1-semialdehyde 2,1-aminomutase
MKSPTDTVRAEFAERFPTSLKRYAEALEVLPGGVTHAARHMKPFPIYISHAQGAYKWDLDGNQFIDYWMGHGALLLGHNHPAVVQAVTEQIQRGTHYSASHELEITWGRWVQRLIPSAERVRFVNSGTEAIMMAIRLARGFTGRNKVIRFAGHFHGWYDIVTFGDRPPFDPPASVGVPEETLAQVKCLPPNNIRAVEKALSEDDGVACIMLEPAGGSNATIPTQAGFLPALRDLCTVHDVILIFDEVISGFRYAPGGAQAYFGVVPDLTTLAKILAGGLPGGAVAGRTDIMALLYLSGDPDVKRDQRIKHPGTFNANPLSAAAGISMLEIAATGEPQEWAARLTLKLIQGMNDILRANCAPGCVYGDRGGFHLMLGQNDFYPDDVEQQIAEAEPERLSKGMGRIAPLVRAAFQLEGIDSTSTSGRLSAAHTEADVERTLASFERVLDRLKRWEVWDNI